MNKEIIEKCIRMILKEIGEDQFRKGLEETPKRAANMYVELFRGYDKDKKPNITIFPNNEDGITYDEMIIDSGHSFSMCEHHMLPFEFSYTFGYIPDKIILGLSKVSRIVDYYAAKLHSRTACKRDCG